MNDLCNDIIFIIENYDLYTKAGMPLDSIKPIFDKVCDKLTRFLKDYEVEYNTIEGKPNKPFIPLYALRDPKFSKYMTQGIYVALLIKRNEGIYVSLNQGTENRKKIDILNDKNKFKRKANDIIATYGIEYKNNIIDDIDLTSNIHGNLKRPKSYEEGNIKAIYYDIEMLKLYPEKFLRDIIWFMELYRKVLLSGRSEVT
ncbi:protein of unknown function [Clostridium amylolyticum]|uniref:Type IV methyl-directed restriction enzyme EcoKMcrB subunit DNA-binding domain-containing protein n=1 Tax=Clostridium amylolyticum TaxID=1121298 RepID=A0A1M6KDR9_9CLOT|nr:DUF3578 domain-containing protein [Clostridium amylolyticum]SHJ57089.1 protein of unknown function [Clostridium amylolyticum]